MQVGVNDDESKRCTFQGCVQVDLLASRCGFCGDMFCADHTSVAAHACRAFDARPPVCPLCHQSVPLLPGESPDAAVSRHMDGGCRPAQASPRAKKERMNYCSCAGCTKNDVAAIICEDCGDMFCIEHRAPARHSCRKSRMPRSTSSPRAATSRSVHSSSASSPTPSSPSKKFPRNTPQTAFGVRVGGAVTPLIIFAKELGVTPFFMYFPRLCVVGRLLDLSVSQAALDSAAVNTAKGAWVVHVVRRPLGPGGFSVFTPSLSATLKEAGVMDGTLVHIGKQEVIPDEVLKEYAPQLSKRLSKGGKDKIDCVLM